MTDRKPAAQAPARELGHMMTFRCIGCSQTRPTLGRRRVLWRGTRQFLCAACSAPSKATPA